MIRQEALHCRRLVRGRLEEVAEATSAEDYLLACALGVVDSRPWINLRRTDASDKRAGDREVGIELDPGAVRDWVA